MKIIVPYIDDAIGPELTPRLTLHKIEEKAKTERQSVYMKKLQRKQPGATGQTLRRVAFDWIRSRAFPLCFRVFLFPKFPKPTPIFGRHAVVLIVVLIALIATTARARAEFTVCNQTLDVINLAVGVDNGEKIQTEGWWTIGANRCVDVIREELNSRYIYVYATDVFGQSVLEGDADMCIRKKKFIIDGTDLCWFRGFEKVRYLEVDTQDTVRWTLFVRQRQFQ